MTTAIRYDDILACAKCSRPYPDEAIAAGPSFACPTCGAKASVHVFPALVQADLKPRFGETILVEGESSCFYHPTKRAATACDQCGRFLCALCEIPMGGQHLCPSCLQANRTDPAKTRMVNTHVLYDTMALDAAILPLILLWMITFITAPASIFLFVRHLLNTKRPIPRNSWRAWAALGIALATLGLWVYIVYSLFTSGSF